MKQPRSLTVPGTYPLCPRALVASNTTLFSALDAQYSISLSYSPVSPSFFAGRPPDLSCDLKAMLSLALCFARNAGDTAALLHLLPTSLAPSHPCLDFGELCHVTSCPSRCRFTRTTSVHLELSNCDVLWSSSDLLSFAPTLAGHLPGVATLTSDPYPSTLSTGYIACNYLSLLLFLLPSSFSSRPSFDN